MKSHARKPSVSVLTRIWFTAFAVVVAGECLVRFYPLPVVQNRTECLIDYQMGKLRSLAKGTIALVGDSCLGNAVDAIALSKCLDRPVVNLALVGSCTTMGDYYLIQHILSNGEDLSGVVIFHTIDLWGRSLHEDSARILDRKFQLPSLEVFWEKLMNKLELCQQSRSYKTLFLLQKCGLTFRRELILQAARFNNFSFEDYDYIAQEPRKDWEHKTGVGGFANFNVNEHVETWLDKTLALCERHKVPVFLANGPIWERQGRLSETYIRRMLDWQRSKAAGWENVALMYERVPVIPTGQLGDSNDHMLPQAKLFFTSWLCGIMRNKLATRTDAKSMDRAQVLVDSLIVDPFKSIEIREGRDAGSFGTRALE